MSVRSNNAMQQVMAIYEALSRGALGAVYEALDEHVVWELYAPDSLAFAGVFRGRAGVARFFDLLDHAVLEGAFDMREFVVGGERVVAIGRQRGIGRETGQPFDIPVIHVWDLVGGRVARWRCALDSGSLQGALGEARAQRRSAA